MIKVCHLITGLGPGGAESMLSKLVVAKASTNLQHTVIAMTADDFYAPMLKAHGIAVHNLGMTRGMPSPGAVFKLVSLLRKIRPDVLQTWLYHADLLGLIAGKLAGVPVISWNIRCSNMDMSRYSRLSRMMPAVLARLSGLPDVCVTNAKAGQREHESLGYHPRRWKVIPNGFDLDRFHPDDAARKTVRQDLGVNDDALVVGMVARLDPMKDHLGLLDAIARRKAAGDHFIAVLIGKGCEPEGTLKREVEARGIDAQVRLLGERYDVAKLLPAFDVFALASFTEGFPNVVGEAMACGVPVIATDVGDCRDIIDKTGILVPPGNVDALTNALIEMDAMGAAGRTSLGKAARARVESVYGLPAVVQQYEDLYLELTGKC